MHLGTIASDRIIECSKISVRDGQEYLHYNAKVVDDIYDALIGRFNLYKNMYWHKTVTAASLLIEEMIGLAVKPLNLVYMTQDSDLFLELTDGGLEEMIRHSHGSKMEAAKALLNKIHARDFPKLVWQELVSKKKITKYMDINDNSVDFKQAVRQYLDDHSGINGIPDDIKLYISHQNPISTVQPDQFDKDKVFVLDEDKQSITFREQLKKTHYFASFCDPGSDETIIVRVYTEKQHVDSVKKLIKKNQLSMSTLMSVQNTLTLNPDPMSVPKIEVEVSISKDEKIRIWRNN